LYEYTPLQIKQGIVGYGRAEKRQVQEMVKVILKLDKIPKPDDVADGLAAAICHAHSLKFADKFKILSYWGEYDDKFHKRWNSKKGLDYIILENNNIGYFINTSLFTLNLFNEGDCAFIYTYLHIREDILALYGLAVQMK